MKHKKKIILLLTLVYSISIAVAQGKSEHYGNYSNNRYPLVQKPYMELQLGSVKAKGWLLEMLERQKAGATGHMDELYPHVMGERNGWLGGDGDQWERGPYWIDGLLPLAYILDDKQLKEKAQPWIEWTLNSQREDGFFGPAKDYPYESGIQRDNAEDWWPRMVALKILQQYYSATQDQRVIPFLTKYFQYQLQTLPEKPMGRWTFWAEYRVCDNLQAVYWLYNITGDSFLLDLGELLHKQSINFTDLFLNGNMLRTQASIHCVNLAQGFKEPIIYYQQANDRKYIDAVKKGFADLKKFNGQAQGMYGGDEALHGNNPTQGVELCSIIEMMFSLEKMIEITGDLSFVDHLEKIAFNALPTQITDDFMNKQYFQQANQVMITRYKRNFYEDHNHGCTPLVYGTKSGYPCCYSNMHQGWPKFTQNLWYATPDNGIASLVFSPSEVTAKVANGVQVRISEDTYYPMDDKIKYTVNILDKKQKQVEFPFHVRIPDWCKQAELFINGTPLKTVNGGKVEIVKRTWKTGDVLELHLPMEITVQGGWHENSVSVERGPLVYALKMNENWKKKSFTDHEVGQFGELYHEVTSDTKWNYGLINRDRNHPNENYQVKIDNNKVQSTYPWNIENAPIEIKVKAKALPYWGLYNEMTGPLPLSIEHSSEPEEEITLIPYGCTTLRISQFPVVH